MVFLGEGRGLILYLTGTSEHPGTAHKWKEQKVRKWKTSVLVTALLCTRNGTSHPLLHLCISLNERLSQMIHKAPDGSNRLYANKAWLVAASSLSLYLYLSISIVYISHRQSDHHISNIHPPIQDQKASLRNFKNTFSVVIRSTDPVRGPQESYRTSLNFKLHPSHCEILYLLRWQPGL